MMSTDVFEIRLGQNVNMYTNRLGHLYITGFVMANIHIMDQYLSPLRYFLIIAIVKLQYNAQ
jgi:hypothetical protein